MAKDSYWFRHDSSAGRGTRIRKIQHIYGHEGKGLYWDVLEVLREQDGYGYEHDDSSLLMLADLVGCKNTKTFINWFNDCIRLELFFKEGKMFFCDKLLETMKLWDSKKLNGSKGGRGHKAKLKLDESEMKASVKQVIEQNITEEQYMSVFNLFQKAYPGTKRGPQVEFDNFKKKHKNWAEVVSNLLPALNREIAYKKAMTIKGEFVAEWKHLSTWINKSCWTEVYPDAIVPVKEPEKKRIGSEFFKAQ